MGSALLQRRSPATPDAERLCRTLGIDSLETLAEHCCQIRRTLGKPTGLCTATAIGQMLHARSTTTAGPSSPPTPPSSPWPPADPATHSPARLPCPGPWWNAAETTTASSTTTAERAGLVALEERLAEADGYRVGAQRRAPSSWPPKVTRARQISCRG